MSISFYLGQQRNDGVWEQVDSEFKCDFSNTNAINVMAPVVKQMDYVGHIEASRVGEVLEDLKRCRFQVMFTSDPRGLTHRYTALIELFMQAQERNLAVVWG